MALNFLGAAGSQSSAKYFDVRLDNDFIFFRGSDIEAASCQLQGSLVLCLTDPLTIKHIKLTLSGIQRMTWSTSSSTPSMSGRRTASKDRRFYDKSWTFRDPGKGKTETLKPDNYEFPFDVVLDGTLPESVEGLSDSWIMYRFKAEIGRKFTKDIVVRKPLRLIRTLDSSALELSHAMSVENSWPNKIDYCISTPSKAIVFGTSIQVDFQLIPLLKGLVMGKVTTHVREEHEFIVDPESYGLSSYSAVQKSDRTIALDEYDISESDAQILDEQAEGFTFSRFLELPKSLNRALQDCNVEGIKIRHKLKFNVQLHNPDGHVSELRANLPVSLYISPSLPINSDNDLIDQSPHAGRLARENDISHSAPPLYGQHLHDQLYSGFDASGYRSPGNFSNSGTPYSNSRNISSENVTLSNAVATGSGPSTPGVHQISPAALQTRLQDLRVSGQSHGSPLATEERCQVNVQAASENTSRRDSGGNAPDYFSHDGSSSRQCHRASLHTLSNDPVSSPEGEGLSRPASGDDQHHSGNHTPHPQYHHHEDLARVPSYSTAVRMPARSTWGSGSDLPSYVRATNLRHPSSNDPPSVPPPGSRHSPQRPNSGEAAPGPSRHGGIFTLGARR